MNITIKKILGFYSLIMNNNIVMVWAAVSRPKKDFFKLRRQILMGPRDARLARIADPHFEWNYINIGHNYVSAVWTQQRKLCLLVFKFASVQDFGL